MASLDIIVEVSKDNKWMVTRLVVTESIGYDLFNSTHLSKTPVTGIASSAKHRFEVVDERVIRLPLKSTSTSRQSRENMKERDCGVFFIAI